MGGIKIFLRLRPPATQQQSAMMGAVSPENEPCDYDVEHEFNHSVWKLHTDRREGDLINNSKDDYSFTFKRVLEPSVTQETVFNIVAKECILSVLDGYNSTIFAYGQTGSGKTYSITGGTESHDDRGIIPRTLEMVYREIHKRSDIKWRVTLSYLQIYNDKGQDLLNHGRDAQTLDDLPVVTVHEGEEEIVLKNLEQHLSPTLEDSLNLLLLGDTNRLYCETPMNKTSSRSHCVFTISLEGRKEGSSVVRRSKLNLVDLAGSERVSKTGVDGNLLNEAKHINLSLHYLEHVIISLNEQASGKRDHVPFRNSFMTMVLRDSLGANCRTSMLATVHTAKCMLPETISTCQFAQRVAQIRQNAHINEEVDPALLVKKLKGEVAQLKDRLAFMEKGGGAADRELDDNERHMCEVIVDSFLSSADPDARIEGFEGDLARIFYCFSVMKRMVSQGGGGQSLRGGDCAVLEDYKSQVEALQISLQQKENEMTMLLDMLHKTNGPKCNAETQTSGGEAEDLQRATSGYSVSQRGAFSHVAAEEVQRPPPPPLPSPSPPHSLLNVPPSAPLTSAAMAKVTALSEQGKMSSAQATAVTEFLQRVEENKKTGISALTDTELLQDRAAALEAFKQSYKGYEKVEEMKKQLKVKYEACKATGREANAINDRIKHIKNEILRMRAERALSGVEEVSSAEENLLAQLREEKQTFNTYIERVKKQKEEIQGIESFLERSKVQLTRNFEEWISVRQRQVQLAMQAMHADPQAQKGSALNVKAAPPVSASAAAPNPNTQSMVISSSTPLYEATSVEHPSSAPSSTTGGSISALPPGWGSPLTVKPQGSGGPPSQRTAGWTDDLPRGASGASEWARGRAANPFHLQPLPNPPPAPATGAGAVSGRSSESSAQSPAPGGVTIPGLNPYSPFHRTTGDAAADQELAALYRAREAIRQNIRL